MADIRLHPRARLILEVSPTEPESSGLADLKNAFAADWREGLFFLAARPDAPRRSPSIRFWREMAADYLTRLCHITGAEAGPAVSPPALEDYETRIQKAPPMHGGEYLTPEILSSVWQSLADWGSAAIEADGGVEAFLAKRAPGWNKVGRVAFHLAENKADPARPFAFMASFTTGLGAGGAAKHLPLGKALAMYAGAGNRPALLKLLSPVHEAANRIPWVKKLAESGDIYRPAAWTADKAYMLLVSVPALEESGLTVRLPDWWKKRPRPRVAVTIGEKKKSVLGVNSLLDFNVGVALGDQRLSGDEIAELLAGGDGLVLFKGQWVELDREKLEQAIDHWKNLEKESENGEISFFHGMRMLAGASHDLSPGGLSDDDREWMHVHAGSAMRDILSRMRDPAGLDSPARFQGLEAELRPYQTDGVKWLHFLTELGLGACLADDMGLGKTLQVLALLCMKNSKAAQGPSLLVIPASLIGNWREEAKRFAPGLSLKILHPSETPKNELAETAASPGMLLKEHDLVITTYSMLDRMNWLANVKWRLVILDEAQAVKNPSTRQSKAVKGLSAQARIALTGTPVENRIGDLWSIFDFLNPGLLGSSSVFKGFVKQMEERPGNTFSPLRTLVSPYILRRLKTDRKVIADLPDKTETVRYCQLSRDQVKLYKKAVDEMTRALETADGIARRGLVLSTLMRLKQICNHPSQLTGDGDYAPERSGKFERIAHICEELAQRQEKVLVFTQFAEIIPALLEHLTEVFGQPGLFLHGATTIKERQARVSRFQDDAGPPFFILSLKAGGTGLNLTAASHVIHFDRWWNPAVENQATDRAFRIGQKKNVLVHKFVTAGTIEERIDRLINEKKELAGQLLSGSGEIKLTELSDDELLKMVRLDVNAATFS